MLIFLQKRILNRELLEFKVKRIQDTVTIQLPCDAESFAFIADIIKELDTDYTLLCAPKQSKIPKSPTVENNLDSKIEDSITDIPASNEIHEKTEDNLPFTEELLDEPNTTFNSEKSCNDTIDLSVSEEFSEEINSLPEIKASPKKRSSLSKDIKDYILSLQPSEQFSNQQILSKFPSCSSNLLSQITIELKKKELIAPVSRGFYQKN